VSCTVVVVPPVPLVTELRVRSLTLNVDGESVEIDASLDPQCQGSHSITRISATQLKKVVRRKEPFYLGSFEPDGSRRKFG
jgi:hypothetical protein